MQLITTILLLVSPTTPGRIDRPIEQSHLDATITLRITALDTTRNPAPMMRDLARVYEGWRRYDSAAAWWTHSLTADPDSDSAIAGRWRALVRADSAAAAPAVAAEALTLAAGADQRSLTLAFDGLSLVDTTLAAHAANRLIASFPDSPRAYELIGTVFYDSLYPIWTNDTLKVALIRRFLTRLPDSEWRQTFYSFLLNSRFNLSDTVGLQADAAEAATDDPLDPLRRRYAAALFNRLELDPVAAERYAREAIELEPRAHKPANRPPEQWALDYPPLFGQARLELASALTRQGRDAEARDWLLQALAEFRWDSNSEWTPAPFRVLLAEIASRQGDTAAARSWFAAALEAGDSRGSWTARADSGLSRLGLTQRQLRAAFNQAGTGPDFTDITEATGLGDCRHSRVAWGDYDNDGWEDLLFDGSRIFRNDSGRHFADVTEQVGLSGSAGRGGVWADFNNDGWLDFYAPGSDSVDRLWQNDSGHFTDVTSAAGYPSDPYPTEGTAWSDFDNDGWVDLYCANYENWQNHSYFPDRLYRNHHGVFVDVTEPAGITPEWGDSLAGRGVNWGDYNDDGWPDCFVSNYRLCRNLCWTNNRDSTLTDRAARLGIAGDEVNGWYGHTIGSAWGDYDNDGDIDLFTADLAHPRYIEFSNRSRLYENCGPGSDPRFVDRRAAAGIRYEETHSDPAWADVDNDGDLDLYITSIYEGRRSFLYENTGHRDSTGAVQFRDVTWRSGSRMTNGWGCAFADFDNDGDVDLVVGSSSGVRLFRNDTRNRLHWLKVKVEGRRANRAGIGSRVTAVQGGQRWIREVEGGKGTTSQNSLIQHFGLGASTEPVKIEVRFGPGRTTTVANVRPDRLVVVREP